MIWLCPNCKAALTVESGSWRCEYGHSFDLAKQGYVNLLLPNQKGSKDPGDNRAMVDGRRVFLRQGHYQPLVTAIAEVIAPHLLESTEEQLTLLDLGCGEGYYLAALTETLPNSLQARLRLNGLDISREAIKFAARGVSQGQFCVASSYHVPVMDAAVDLALQVFAPAAETEIKRLLRPNGLWLRVAPGPHHLYQLKAALYQSVREHIAPTVPAGFRLVTERQVNFPLLLRGQEAISSLLSMTPFAWHGSREGHAALKETPELTTEADFVVQLMQVH